MKALKIIGNIFGVILAVFMSVVLLALLVATPVITSVTLVKQPETIKEVIKQPEVVEMIIAEIPGIDVESDETGINKELVENVVQSKAFEDFVEIYTEQTIGNVTGETEAKVTVEVVQQVIENNKQEVIEMVRPIAPEYVEEGEEITDEKIEEIIDYAVENYGQDFIDSLPTGDDLMDLLNNYSGDINGLISEYGSATNGASGFGAPLKMSTDLPGVSNTDVKNSDAATSIADLTKAVLDGTLPKMLIGAIVLASVLILLFRWPRFKGLMWLFVTYLLGGGLMFGCSVLLCYPPMVEELTKNLPIPQVVFALIAEHIRSYAIVFLIVAGVCLVLFIIGRIILKLLKNRRKKAIQVAAEEPVAVEEPTVEEEVPAEEEAPVEKETLVEEETSVEEETPVEEEISVEEETPVEEEVAEEDKEIVTAE